MKYDENDRFDLSTEAYRIKAGFYPFKTYVLPKYAKMMLQKIGAHNTGLIDLFNTNLEDSVNFLKLMNLRGEDGKEFPYAYKYKLLRFKNPWFPRSQMPIRHTFATQTGDVIDLSTRILPNKSYVFSYPELFKRYFLTGDITDPVGGFAGNYVKMMMMANKYDMLEYVVDYILKGLEGFTTGVSVTKGSTTITSDIVGMNPMALMRDIVVPVRIPPMDPIKSTMLYRHVLHNGILPLQVKKSLAYIAPIVQLPILFMRKEFICKKDPSMKDRINALEERVKELLAKYSGKNIRFVFYNDKNFMFFNLSDIVNVPPNAIQKHFNRIRRSYRTLLRAKVEPIAETEEDEITTKLPAASATTIGSQIADGEEKVAEEPQEQSDASDKVLMKKKLQSNVKDIKRFVKHSIKHNPKTSSSVLAYSALANAPMLDDDDEESEPTPETADDDNILDDATVEDVAAPSAEEINDEVNIATTGTTSGFNTRSLSKKQLDVWENTKEKYKSIKDPSTGRTLKEVMDSLENMEIDTPIIPVDSIDESFKTNVARSMRTSYIDKKLNSDIFKVLADSFKSESMPIPMTIVDITTEDISTVTKHMVRYNVVMKDIKGKNHNIHFKIPKIDEEGRIYINGSKKVIKNQAVLLPISKLGPQKVMFSSNHNKGVMTTHGDYLSPDIPNLVKFITFLSAKNLVKLNVGKSDNSGVKTNLEYDSLSQKLFQVIVPNRNDKSLVTECYFSQANAAERVTALDPAVMKKIAKDRVSKPGLLILGAVINKKESKLVKIIAYDERDNDLSASDMFWSIFYDNGYSVYIRSDATKGAEDGEDLFSFNNKLVKPLYTEVLYMTRNIPLIFFLGVQKGLHYLLQMMTRVYDLKYELTHKRKSLIDASAFNYVKFKNVYLYYPKANTAACLLLNGLAVLGTTKYTYEEFDDLIPYTEYAERRYKSRHIIKGLRTCGMFFIDPITKDVLTNLKLPTEFNELMLYANSLLEDFDHKSETDLSLYRTRSAEIIPVLIYKNLVRQYDVLTLGGAAKSVSLPEDAILGAINKAFLLEQENAVTPTAQDKGQAGITWKGPGGINNERAFSKAMRAFDDSFVGVIGMSSIDSSKVGINRYMTRNPSVVNTLGIIKPLTEEERNKAGSSNLFTSEEGAIPNLERDDPKRIGFASIQTSAVIPTQGMAVYPITTGYTTSSVYSTSSDFTMKAKIDGVVRQMKDEEAGFIIIENKEEKKVHNYPVTSVSNVYFGVATNVQACVKVGQKVKKGELIAYSRTHFKENALGEISNTQGSLAMVAVLEDEHTEEDSSAVSESFSNKATVRTIHKQTVALPFTAKIFKSVEIGQHVMQRDLLIQSTTYDDQGMYDSINMSKEFIDSISAAKFKAEVTGTIKDVKVFYSRELTEASASISKFAKDIQKPIRDKISDIRKTTGKPDAELMLNLKPVPLASRADDIMGFKDYDDVGIIVIQYIIEHDLNLGQTDKISINSALKTIIQDVIPDDQAVYTLDPKTGEKVRKVDVIMSLLSGANRLVSSHYFNGTKAKIIHIRGKQIAEEYFGK